MECDIRDKGLSKEGKRRIEWAERNMPVLSLIEKRFKKERPLLGKRISACLHVTTETANLVRTLATGGAEVRLCASNPLSTQDDVAASLVMDYGIAVFAITGEDNETYYKHINSCLDFRPHITMDDGADLISTIHSKRKKLIPAILGGTEETTTGVIRLRSMAKKGVLRYPVIAVNDSLTKHLFDNRYGTGQSTIDGILRATNTLVAGKTFCVCGYGWCGKGIAKRADGMGARVIVCEVDPVKAIEALMDGFLVMPGVEAIKEADIMVTVTGDINVIDRAHFEAAKDGIILANSGHFDVEINAKALEEMSEGLREVRNLVDEYTIKDGRKIYLLAKGRLVNLSCAEGHPPEVMDMSFANQALAAEYIINNKLPVSVHRLPTDMDREIAELKLKSMGKRMDTLTEEQKAYLEEWQMGT